MGGGKGGIRANMQGTPNPLQSSRAAFPARMGVSQPKLDVVQKRAFSEVSSIYIL